MMLFYRHISGINAASQYATSSSTINTPRLQTPRGGFDNDMADLKSHNLMNLKKLVG